MTYGTVKRYADAVTPEELFQGQWQGRPSKLDEFKPYLNRIKMLKRQMYGRAGFDLLRKRVLLAG